MFSQEVLSRFDLNGPRYTSYPSADRFTASVGVEQARQALDTVRGKAISLYVHIPYCRSLCYYCACNKIVTKNPADAEAYLDLLAAEIALVGPYSGRAPVRQIALGGGTPNFLTLTQQERLWKLLDTHFQALPEREQAIELDPRYLDRRYVEALVGLGYNRMSFGVQDFDPEVQKLIHRFQSFQQTADAVAWARAAGVPSISFDLVYGLPLQTRASFAATLERVIALEPDRVALFNYAHIPERFKAQRRIPSEALPTIAERVERFLYASERLADAGYQAIGLDHFAKPPDSLAQAARDGSLRRNFQGYSTHGGLDLIGLGVSAISDVAGVLSQNTPQVDVYRERLRQGQLATVRGLVRDADDRLRAEVIERIMCHGRVEWSDIEASHGSESMACLKPSILALQPLVEIDAVRLTPERLEVTEAGRLLLRAVAMAFDTWRLRPREESISFSRIA